MSKDQPGRGSRWRNSCKCRDFKSVSCIWIFFTVSLLLRKQIRKQSNGKHQGKLSFILVRHTRHQMNTALNELMTQKKLKAMKFHILQIIRNRKKGKYCLKWTLNYLLYNLSNFIKSLPQILGLLIKVNLYPRQDVMGGCQFLKHSLILKRIQIVSLRETSTISLSRKHKLVGNSLYNIKIFIHSYLWVNNNNTLKNYLYINVIYFSERGYQNERYDDENERDDQTVTEANITGRHRQHTAHF